MSARVEREGRAIRLMYHDRVACLSSGQWATFAAGRLSAEGAAEVEQHLLACGECRLTFGWTGETSVTHGDGPGGGPGVPSPEELGRGTTVGRYLVLDKLGSGGMGLVYAAFDPQLDRKVAIKLLRADLGEPARAAQFRTRMLREAQAMARLQHPNVIAVHDVGTFEERVFLAMELVEGGTLKDWLRERPRGYREVLEVYLAAGRGLAAAHDAGLVHRDFKPDNVLIGRDGRPRVTDFGLARGTGTPSDELIPAAAPSSLPSRALERSPSSSSLEQPLTRAGTVMGTPGYMAPEQCLAQPTDERSDQFSYCAALYEALYGQRAFPGVSPDQIMEAVQRGEVKDAPASSDVPAWVRRILLRGLRVDPGARYPSMRALLDELGHDPAVRRRRVLAAVGVLAVLAGGATLVQWKGARQGQLCKGAERNLAGVWDAARKQASERAFLASEKPYASHAWLEVSRALDAYAASFVAMHVETCEATRLRGEQSETVMSLRMACLDERRQSLRALTDLFTAADGQTVEQSVQAVHALAPVEACANVRALMAVLPPPSDPALRARIDRTRGKLAEAHALLQAGKYQPGLAVAEPEVLEAAAIGYRPLSAEALALAGKLRFKAGDYQGADRGWKEAVWAAEEARLDEVKSAVAIRLADVSVDLHGYDRAHEWLRYAEAAMKRIGAAGPLKVDLGISTAMVSFRESHYAEAESAARRAVALAERVLAPNDLQRAAAYRTLGDVLKYEGQYADGLALLEKARVIDSEVLGAEHPEVAAILRKQIDVYSLQHDGKRGLELGRRVLAMLEKSLPPGHLQIAQTHTNLAESLGLLGRYEEALGEEKQALPTYQRVFGPESEDVGVSYTNLGYALAQLGRDDEARGYLEHAVAIYEKTLAPGTPDLAEPILRLGELSLKRHRAREAIAFFERALELRAKDHDPSEMLADVELGLARALGEAASDPVRAHGLAASAAEHFRAGGKAPRAAEADAWAAKHPLR